MTALPLRKPDPYEDDEDEGDEELPTNQLTSGRLSSRPLHAVPSADDEGEPSNVIDWVSRISNTQASSVHRQRNTISLLPPPTGMYQHVTPARMVPARGSWLGTALRKVGLYFLLPALLLGGAAWAVVATVGTGWIADIFAPPPPQTLTETEPLETGFGPGPDSPAETGLPPIEGNAEELRQRGISLLGEKNYTEAIRYLEGAANTGTEDALAYYHLGLAYLAVADRPHAVDDAELAFRTAASLQPNWAAAHRMLAESLVRGGYYEEAIGPALEATRLEPNMSEAWLTLSGAYKGAGRDTEATQAYAEATRHSPAPPMSP